MTTPIKYTDPYYDSLDRQAELNVGLPTGLLSAIRLHGERTNADRVSSDGAKSVYQIIPSTRKSFLKKYGVDADLSVENAAHVAALVLKEGLDRNGGDSDLAAAEYHGGTDRSRWGPITHAYRKRVRSGWDKLVSALNPISEAQAEEFTTDSQTYQEFLDWEKKQQEPQEAQQQQDNGYGLRPDGTQKGKGYLGELKRPDGSVMTEYSIGVNIDGKEVDIPTIVPSLNKEEINYLLNIKEGEKIPDSIIEKAVDFAKDRKKKGLPFFADNNKDEVTTDPETYQKFIDWEASQQRPEQTKQELPLSTALTNAVVNSPNSFYKMGSGLVDAAMNPLDTVAGVARVAHGAIQSAVPDELIDIIVQTGLVADDRPKAKSLAQDYINAYGGWENIKQTISTDPARVLSDLSMLAGGAGMAANGAGMTRTAAVLEKASVATDPLQMIAKAGRTGGKAAIDIIGSAGTHTGGESIVKAFQAGLQGGTKSKAFIDAMTNEANIADVVPVLKEALHNMRTERMQNYVGEMASLNGNPAILNLNNIESVAKAATLGKFKDYVYNKKSIGVQKEILNELKAFKKLDPREYHTIEGVDKFKQAIGDIRDSTEYGTPSRVVADRVYNAIKKEIIRQDGKYGEIMQAYETASEKIKEVEKTFSLSDKASQDSAIRKLQSVLRNNANTNYGNRGALMTDLEKYGAGDVPSSLAGQSMNTWTPRGLGAPVMAGNIGYGFANPAALLAVPFQSPKLVGKVVHGAGSAARPIVETYKKTPAEIKRLIEDAAKKRNSTLPRMHYQVAARTNNDN